MNTAHSSKMGDNLKVLMLGWEFPPFISGGLGTACYGLTRAMSQMGLNVKFVLPKAVDQSYTSHVKLLNPSALKKSTTKITEHSVQNHTETELLKNVQYKTVDSPLQPYSTPKSYQERLEQIIRRKRHRTETNTHESELENEITEQSGSADYQGDLYSEVQRYSRIATDLASSEDFDIIHAHDWMTYSAGIRVAEETGKPLVVHVHSTEFDRSGEHVNQMVYDIERRGMHYADKVIAVSYLTRNIVISRYGVPGDKVEVVHNGVERKENNNWLLEESGIEKNEHIVLFLGRITFQKGPEYFLHAAKKVLEHVDNVKFVMAGSGDMMNRAVELAAELGIGSKVLFTGFLRGEAVDKIYRMADLFVMPSVSEPFGIVPLEALRNDVPAIISKQSGVSEVLRHVLKVDFWDTEEIANKVIAVLKYQPLKIMLKNHGNFEVRRLQWKDTAQSCARIYREALVAG